MVLALGAWVAPAIASSEPVSSFLATASSSPHGTGNGRHLGRLKKAAHAHRAAAATPSAKATAEIAPAPAASAHTESAGVSPTTGTGGTATPTQMSRATPTTTSTSAGPSSTASPSGSTGIFGLPFHLKTGTEVQNQYNAYVASGDTTKAALLKKIAFTPTGSWFGAPVGGSADLGFTTSAVRFRVDQASATGTIPTLVMYNIPKRDCGDYSSSVASTSADYRAWVDAFVQGMGSRKAIVVVEPDGLSVTRCLDAAQLAQREADIKYATTHAAAQGSFVYIDIGSPNMGSGTAGGQADRLIASGVAAADGFAVDVSQYQTTAIETAYANSIATAVQQKLGGDKKHYVIDTSRNGRAPQDNQWCNPPWAGLGAKPTAQTGNALADAYLWVHGASGSDGPCNGCPSSGRYCEAFALQLAQNASW